MRHQASAHGNPVGQQLELHNLLKRIVATIKKNKSARPAALLSTSQRE